MNYEIFIYSIFSPSGLCCLKRTEVSPVRLKCTILNGTFLGQCARNIGLTKPM